MSRGRGEALGLDGGRHCDSRGGCQGGGSVGGGGCDGRTEEKKKKMHALKTIKGYKFKNER